MTVETFDIFFRTIGIIAGFIVTLTGAIFGIVKLIEIMNKRKKESTNKINETLSKHNVDIKELKFDMAQLKIDIKENKEMTILICKGVKSLMDNSISGNGIENLKKTRKELDDFLIEKK